MHKTTKSVMPDLCTKSHPLPQHKLSLLMTLLCNGKPNFRIIPLALDTIYQQIIVNTKKTSIELGTILPCDRVLSFQKHSFEIFKNTFFIEHLRWLLLSFLDKLSETVHVLFNDSENKILQSVLCKGIFTAFVDDKINKNSSMGQV